MYIPLCEKKLIKIIKTYCFLNFFPPINFHPQYAFRFPLWDPYSFKLKLYVEVIFLMSKSVIIVEPPKPYCGCLVATS